MKEIWRDFQSMSRCFKCGSSLELKSRAEAFACTGCGANYPIVDSIPRFVADEDYTASFGYQWNKHAQTQLDKFNGLTISRDRLFKESHWQPSELRGRRVLECGSGAGRFTQILCESEAKVFSIDFSRAVEANWSSNGANNNLFLAQASIYDLPFKEKGFDYLICLGVIQHTPDVRRTVKTMLKYLRPGGKFCIDVYAAPLSYLHPRHVLRPWTKRMNKQKLYDLVESWVPRLLPVSTFFHKVPVVGQVLARMVPVANWRANIRLPDEGMYKDWAVLDTFDWLSPEYEQPQRAATLKSWLQDAGIVNYELERQRGLYVIRGEAPAGGVPGSELGLQRTIES